MTRHLSPDMAPDEFDRLLAAWMDADAQRGNPRGSSKPPSRVRAARAASRLAAA